MFNQKDICCAARRATARALLNNAKELVVKVQEILEIENDGGDVLDIRLDQARDAISLAERSVEWGEVDTAAMED